MNWERFQHPLPGRLWVVRLAEVIAGRIKTSVDRWPTAEKDKLGDQIVRSADSIGINIAEGYVRVHTKERLHFYSIARGSLEEVIRHLRKACDRSLVTRIDAYTLFQLLTKLNKGLNNLERKDILLNGNGG